MHVSIHPHRRLHWLLYFLLALLAILLLADTASAQVGRRLRRVAGVVATARAANVPVGPGVAVGPSVPMPPPPLGFFGFPPGVRPPFMFSRIRVREPAPTAQAAKQPQSAPARPAAVKSERESPAVVAEELPPGELLPAAPAEPISNVKPAKAKRGTEF